MENVRCSTLLRQADGAGETRRVESRENQARSRVEQKKKSGKNSLRHTEHALRYLLVEQISKKKGGFQAAQESGQHRSRKLWRKRRYDPLKETSHTTVIARV